MGEHDGTRDRSEPPTVTFIIPVRPGAGPPTALAAIDALRYPRARIEILVVEGHNPSCQRNHAIRRARGELLYFLDDDTELDPWALDRALECFVDHPERDRIDGVGGPVLTKPTDMGFQKAAGAALGSVFGLGPFRHRFVPYGLVREAGERELISANLVLRRSVFAAAPGFDERLFGNEENELMNRIQSGGARLFYHPLMFCRRSQRATLAAVCRQHFHYGRGRLRHFVIRPRAFEPILLAPTGLLAAGLLAALRPHWLTAVPLFVYALLAALASLSIAWREPAAVRTFVYLAAIFPAMHLSYGAGMAWELACRLTRRTPQNSVPEVVVRVLRPLEQA